MTRIGPNSNLFLKTVPFSPLSNSQLKMDACVASFSTQASNWSSIASLSFAGLAGQFARTGILASFQSKSFVLSTLHHLTSQAGSIGVEAATLELCNHLFEPVQNPFYDSFFHSLITLGTFRIFSPLMAGHNLFLQQGVQATALVSAHQIAARMHLQEIPTESFSEQFINAIASNLSIEAGSKIGAHLTGARCKIIERALHTSVSTEQIHTREAKALLEYSTAEVTSPAALAVQRQIGDFEARSHYSQRLLEMSLNRFIESLRLHLAGRHDQIGNKKTQIENWLEEVSQTRDWANIHTGDLTSKLIALQTEGGVTKEQSHDIQNRFIAQFTQHFHLRNQLAACNAALHETLGTESNLWEIRRRLDWILTQEGFNRNMDLSLVTHIPEYFRSERTEDRYEIGRALLRRLHPQLSEADIEVFEKAATGSIQGRHIAFGLDKTLGDTHAWHLAHQEIDRHPEHYDGIDRGYFAHQTSLMRLPYAQIQATLLGLWASGNTLKLYTSSQNKPGNHDAFFNDFPLLKIAFGFVNPENPFELVTPESLHASPHYMDELKRAEFHERYFGGTEGQTFATHLLQEASTGPFEEFKNSKIPFPDFYYDVHVDDLHCVAGEMQTLGFGRRWVEARKTGEGLLGALEEYFDHPVPPLSPTLHEWFRREDLNHHAIEDTRQLQAYLKAAQDGMNKVLSAYVFLYNEAYERPLLGFDRLLEGRLKEIDELVKAIDHCHKTIQSTGIGILNYPDYTSALKFLEPLPDMLREELRKTGMTPKIANQLRSKVNLAAGALGVSGAQTRDFLSRSLPVRASDPLHAKTATLDQVEGIFEAAAIADAHGAPFEFMTAAQVASSTLDLNRFNAKGSRPAGSWTDDTLFVVATLDSILRERAIVPRKLAQAFAALAPEQKRRGFGNATKTAMKRMGKGQSWSGAGQEDAAGNGAAMRIAPIAVFSYRDLESLRKNVIMTSQMTHAGYEAISASLATAFIIAKIIRKQFRPETILQETRRFIGPGKFSSRLNDIETHLENEDLSTQDGIRLLGTGGVVWESVASAIYTFLRHPQDFNQILRELVQAGGDTDTMAAIAGHFYGALNGRGNIESKWTEQLEERENILARARRLYQLIHH